MAHPYFPDYSNAVVTIAENANGSYKLYELSYMNVSLDFVLSFPFVKTPDSTKGPILNATEISKYVEIAAKTDRQDAIALRAFSGISPETLSIEDEGDPCNPVPWEWVMCSSTPRPRITKLLLSRKNLTGTIPLELQNMEGLIELWLDGNSLTGPVPDLSNLINLRIIHLENNRLNGTIPSYMSSLPSLQELYIQNNCFSGKIPPGLLSGKVQFNFQGNPKLAQGAQHSRRFKLIIGFSVVAIVVLIVLLFGGLLQLRHFRKKVLMRESDSKGDTSRPSTNSSTNSLLRSAHTMDEGVACYIKLDDIEAASANFSKNIGKGSFGCVFYGKMKDGKEVSVKIIADPTSQGTKKISTEVSLLSRIHHRNLVPLIGYCEEANHRILVYEYMHNGTLWDHIHGLEYLHNGCNPSIIHRDVKTSNIVLDINMRERVADFGLSRMAEEDLTHISSVARGALGYLDPETVMRVEGLLLWDYQ